MGGTEASPAHDVAAAPSPEQRHIVQGAFSAIVRLAGRGVRSIGRWVSTYLHLLVLSFMGVIVLHLYQADIQRQATEDEVIARVLELRKEGVPDEERVAFLSALGKPAMPILMNMLRTAELAVEADWENHREVEGDHGSQKQDYTKFQSLSFALFGDGSKDRLEVVKEAILQHPDPIMRRACIRSLEVVPRSDAVAFLTSVVEDKTQSEKVRAAALVAATEIMGRFGIKRKFSNVEVTDDHLFQNRSFDGLVLTEARLHDVDLHNAGMRGVRLENVVLEADDLSNSDWGPLISDGSEKRFADGTKEGSAYFEGVRIVTKGSLTNATFSGNKWIDTTIQSAPLAVKPNEGAQSGSLNFIGAQLRRVTFQDLDVNGVFFGGAILEDVTFDHGRSRNLTFDKDSRLVNVTFVGGTLEGADFGGALLYGVELHHCQLHNVIFSGSTGFIRVTKSLVDAIKAQVATQAPNLRVEELAGMED